jgi:hypothetical protein
LISRSYAILFPFFVQYRHARCPSLTLARRRVFRGNLSRRGWNALHGENSLLPGKNPNRGRESTPVDGNKRNFYQVLTNLLPKRVGKTEQGIAREIGRGICASRTAQCEPKS